MTATFPSFPLVPARSAARESPLPCILHEVRAGLFFTQPKELPSWLLYDEEGARLHALLASSPGFDLARIERALIHAHADELASLLGATSRDRCHVVELGAGAAERAEILLRALVRRQGRTRFVAVEPRAAALRQAHERLAQSTPGVELRSLAVLFERDIDNALAPLQVMGPRSVALVSAALAGRIDDEDLVAALRALRAHLGRSASLVLLSERPRDPAAHLAAFDDGTGLAAAFNKNVLTRINRELAARFDLHGFGHRVRWNGASAAVELHLESLGAHRVRIGALGAWVTLARGETVQTATFRTRTDDDVARLLARAGWCRERSFGDAGRRCSMNLCRAL